jgi:mannose-6-phosphate isomerase-like protein (cupin superfamily)
MEKMEYTKINLREKLGKFSDQWVPRIVAQLNDYHIKVVKVQGEFVWHDHLETDELFLVLGGRLEIHLRDGKVELDEGEMFVVPKGIEHKPVAEGECQLLLIEPAGTINTGREDSALTAKENLWI